MRKRLLSLLLITALTLSTFFVTPVTAQSKGSGSYPAKYDGRTKGLVTQVRNQDKYATCYAFGICSTLESVALMKGYGDFNLSERHLAYFTTHFSDIGNKAIDNECPVYCEDRKWFEEHTSYGPLATLMKGFGPALESSYSYPGIRIAIPGNEATESAFKVTRIINVPYDDPDAVKAAVTKYGAVCINLYPCCWNIAKAANTTTGAVYAADTKKGTGFHFVSIIGWDDNYSKNNFRTTPPGDGAWIVKNSWGARSGDKGYYYVSYYDAELTDALCPWFTFDLGPTSMYDYLYQYDGGAGLEEVSGVSSVAMVIKAKENESLTGIEIKPQEASNTTVSIYRNVSSPKSIGSAKAIHTQTFKIEEPQYQTLEFNKAVNVNSGETILVVVSFKSSIGYYADMAYESDREQGGRGIATANRGETFVKRNGSWSDLATCLKKPASACMKVLSRKGHNRRVIKSSGCLNMGTTSFTASNNQEAAVALSWKKVTKAKGYDIYRKADGEKGYKLLKSVSAKTLKYTDTKLTLGKKYSYMVIAVSGSSESASQEKTITATIEAPSIKKLDNSKRGKIKITISKTKSAKSYSIYRLEGKSYKWIGSTADGTYTDSTVSNGVTYSYKVRATSGKLLSAMSAAKKVTAKN